MTSRTALLALALCAPWLAAAADAPPVLKIHQHSLANGLKIVLAKDSSRPVVNLQVWYHVGSKDEKAGRTGFAHLFEHMMFRGSRNLGPEEHMRLVREAGGEVNAYTTFDATVYWETFPSNYLEQMIWLEADRMASLVINEENFKKEREVVKEERRMRVDNPPYGKLMDDVLASAYQSYPYKHSPIGTMDDLNKATVADVKEFHDTFYVPNNATVVAVGDFEVEEALALIRKHFTPIPRGKSAVPRVTATEPAQAKFAEVNKAYDNAPLEGVVSAWKLPPGNHPDRYALEIAGQILSSGQSSRLYQRLVYDEQAAVAAFGQGLFMEGPSLFFGAAIANQGKNIKEVSSSFQFVIEQMRKEPVTAEELDKARNQGLAGFITGKETMQSKADLLGAMAVLRGDAELYNTEIENYRKVTAADVQRAVRKYLTAANETRLWVKPEVKK